MSTSRLSKGFRRRAQVASGSAVGGGTLRLQLNRDWLIAEHVVNLSVSQAYTGVPTSVDVRDFVSSVAIETSDGRRLFLSGAQVYDLGRFTESASLVQSTLAATSLANWSFEIHHENDGALLDLFTALRSNELTTLDLVVTFASDANNGFKGGTVPLVATYNVSVESKDYKMLDSVQFGYALGSFSHWQEKQELANSVVGATQEFQIITGNRTRFLMLHCYDTTPAGPDVLSDSIIGNIRVSVGGEDKVKTTFLDTRKQNSATRGFNQVGVCVLDFGDDENGWLDIDKVNQAKVQIDILSTAPAGWRVVLGQDYMTSRER